MENEEIVNPNPGPNPDPGAPPWQTNNPPVPADQPEEEEEGNEN